MRKDGIPCGHPPASRLRCSRRDVAGKEKTVGKRRSPIASKPDERPQGRPAGGFRMNVKRSCLELRQRLNPKSSPKNWNGLQAGDRSGRVGGFDGEGVDNGVVNASKCRKSRLKSGLRRDTGRPHPFFSHFTRSAAASLRSGSPQGLNGGGLRAKHKDVPHVLHALDCA